MNLLALDTATECCSVALWHEGRVCERSELAPRRHAELVLPMTEAVLSEAGITRADIDAIAVGRGPGAFTGVRLGVALAQGLALALDVPVVPVSSLAALAQQAASEGPDLILAVIDARMDEVYAGWFRRSADGVLPVSGEEVACPPEAVTMPDAGASWQVIGSGWASHAVRLETAIGQPPVRALPERWPQARDIAILGRAGLEAGRAVPPERALPVYLRNKVAQTTAERAAERSSDEAAAS